MKKIILKLLREYISVLTKLISKLESQLKNRAGGYLKCRKVGGKIYYSVVSEVDGKERYLKDGDGLIIKLAKEQYLSRLLIVAKRQVKRFEGCVRLLTSGDRLSDIDDVYDSLSDEVRALVSPSIETTDGYAENWEKKMRSAPHQGYPIENGIMTLGGDYVRSKSEAIIADRLYAAGVPYSYELQMCLKKGDKEFCYPDFTILNKRTRKIIIWEHFGKMDETNYLAKTQEKLKMYELNDYHLGDNMIVSFEGSNIPIDTEYVDMLIKNYIL